MSFGDYISIEGIRVRKANISDFDFYYSVKCEKNDISWGGFESQPDYNMLFERFKDILNKVPGVENEEINSTENNLPLLKGGNRDIYIIEYQDNKCGYIYVDKVEKNRFELSIGVSEKYSGKHVAREAIKKIVSSIREKNKLSVFQAWIREDSISSQKAFINANFKPTKDYKLVFLNSINAEIKMFKYINKPSFTDRVFIVAEAGVNHNGKLEMAFDLIDAAKDAGADAIKFQTFKTEKIVSKNVEMASYQKENLKNTQSQYDMIKNLELPYQDFIEIKKYCDEVGILFFSTPDEEESLDFLVNELCIPLIKIGSGEITNIPFLQKIASKNLPIILSTGMANLGEIYDAIQVILSLQKCLDDIQFDPLVLLHCTTNYPTPFEEVNLKAMLTLKEAFRLPVGYSDHTLGVEVPIAAVALGARVIEKHFTIDKNLPGPDHKASLEPHEFKTMVNAIRNIEKALGDGIKRPTNSEEEMKDFVRKSLVASRDIKKGEIIKEDDIEIKRPGSGILPKFKEIIIGMRITKDIERDTPFDWSYFKEE